MYYFSGLSYLIRTSFKGINGSTWLRWRFSLQDLLWVPGCVLRLPQQTGGAVHETTQCHDSFPDQIVSHPVCTVHPLLNHSTLWTIKLKQPWSWSLFFSVLFDWMTGKNAADYQQLIPLHHINKEGNYADSKWLELICLLNVILQPALVKYEFSILTDIFICINYECLIRLKTLLLLFA